MGASRSPFGKLKNDPNKILDLPEGFEYSIISEQGTIMSDGLKTPAQADGMAAFKGSNGNINLVLNHENHPASFKNSPFGTNNEYLGTINLDHIYDQGNGSTPGTGGTTTIEYDPLTKQTKSQHLLSPTTNQHKPAFDHDSSSGSFGGLEWKGVLGSIVNWYQEI